MSMRKFIGCFFIFLLTVMTSVAQDEPTDTITLPPRSEDVVAVEQDTTTEEVKKDIFRWTYNLTHTDRIRVDIVTTMDFFYLFEPNGSIADYNVNVAEYASPAFPLIFSPHIDGAFFLQPHEMAFYTTDNMYDYTAQRPYSELRYSQGLNSERSAQFFHTQNVNRYCNLGLMLDFYKNIGEWDKQSIKGQHIAPWISYYGPRFSTVFKYAFNNVKREENGGIAEDSLLNYEKLLYMKYTNALSTTRYQTATFDQKWNLGKKPKEDSTSLEMLRYKNALGYNFSFLSAKRYYSDSDPDTAYYANVLYDSTATVDSSLYKEMEQSFYLEMRRKTKSIDAVAKFAVGSTFEMLMYHDYNYSIPEYFCNSQFYEGTFNVSLPKHINVAHQHRFCFMGEDQGDFSLYTELSKDFELPRDHEISIEASHELIKSGPASMYYDFESNHYSWHNDFLAEETTDFHGAVNSTWGDISADVHFYSLKDYVYTDKTGQFIQTNGSGHAYTANIQKTTRFWHIIMKNGILLQNVSVGEQKYPSWATYNMLAVQAAFLHKLIHFSLGGECLYYPSYNVPTYDAALGIFKPQDKVSYGGFPFINAFMTIKYKPIKLFVKYTGLYALLAEQNYPIAGYPQTNGTISFGLSWLFYN